MNEQTRKSSVGMDANNWVLIVYLITMVLGWIGGVCYFAWLFPLVVYLIEKQSGFVKFYAMQAVALYVLNALARVVLDIAGVAVAFGSCVGILSNPAASGAGLVGGSIAVSVLGGIVTVLVTIGAILAMVRAYKYESYRIPFAAPFADKLKTIGK